MRLHAAIPVMLVSAVALAAPKPYPPSSDGAGAPTPFEAAPIPSTSSAPPNAAEWDKATPIALKWSFGCHARLSREWVRVWCPGPPVRVAVIDGDRSDVVFTTELASALDESGKPQTRTTGAMVAFPLRRGARRAIQIWSTVEEVAPGKTGRGDVRLISAYWLEDEPRPVVTIQ